MVNFTIAFFSRENHFIRTLPSLFEPGFFNLTSTYRSDSDLPAPYLYTNLKDTLCPQCVPNATVFFYKDQIHELACFSLPNT